MDCAKLHKDISDLETIQAKFSSKLESATESGLDKADLDGLYQEASTTSESLLEQYAYDLVEQNLKDKSGRNTAFLNSILERYWEEQTEQSRQANLAEPNTTNQETADSPEFIITNDTTINEVRANLTEYLKVDKKLDSNLLAYAVKERLGLLPNQSQSPTNSSVLKSIEELYKGSLPGQTLPRLAYLYKIAERIRNLETLETDHYIFMLPKDKWNEGKIELPNPNNDPEAPKFIAPNDLTAILKSEVYYNYKHETNGQLVTMNGEHRKLVYNEEWVGKEIHHFPWSKELIEEANENLLKPNGYHIPESWKPIVDSISAEIANEQRTEPEEVTFEQISTALQEDFSLAFSGCVREGNLEYAGFDGFFWSATEASSRCIYMLWIDQLHAFSGSNDFASDARSVRCIS